MKKLLFLWLIFCLYTLQGLDATMENYNLTFQLNENERIVIKLEEPIQEVHCCYSAPMIFITEANDQYVVYDDVIREGMYYLSGLLNRALQKKLTLDESLSLSNIGYVFNPSRCNSSKLASPVLIKPKSV